jgi:hypothetical protein
MSPQHTINRALCPLQFRQRALREGGGKAGGEQQHVLIAQRDIQVFGEPRNHVTTGLRLAGLEIRQMPGRAPRRVCEIGLRHATPFAATPKEDAERELISRHPASLAAGPTGLNDLGGQIRDGGIDGF